MQEGVEGYLYTRAYYGEGGAVLTSDGVQYGKASGQQSGGSSFYYNITTMGIWITVPS